jgi:hypothetical protein
LKILDVEFNDTNGGSFSVVAAKKTSPLPEATALLQRILTEERQTGLETSSPFERFCRGMQEHKESVRKTLHQLTSAGKRVLGYGASTKGNVLLQYCGIDKTLLPAIAEVNEDKFGSVTPGTNIPIISERDALDRHPDYFFVLPWHFRSAILDREREFLACGGGFIFPLPTLEIVSKA